MEDVVDLLKQYFSIVNFEAEFDNQMKKWLIFCDNFKIYFSEEMKEVLQVIRHHYNTYEFVVVFRSK